jgi:haloacetate dehalogenase
MCLDHGDKVRKAAFPDMLPQHHLLNNITMRWCKFSGTGASWRRTIPLPRR